VVEKRGLKSRDFENCVPIGAGREFGPIAGVIALVGMVAHELND